MTKPKHEKPLTHEEIWDDSALVRSWEDAVEEYQLYHSIHAKGENVEDVLREAEASGITEDVNAVGDDEEMDTEDIAMEGEPEASILQANANTVCLDQYDVVFLGHINEIQASHHATEEHQQPTEEEPTPATTQGSKIPPNAMPMPEPILAQVQDEKLKSLMMAWYYAGYYTGLYEGQQHANQKK
ncbi:uncharacterized protein N7483_012146 [Penicillium malachiteum]|uniref:uncharacterized protein n=1 Tax=Penicillium malachiteum TaxID=1324776 RepID=UPI002547238D|nr:uncharacterized protein N7483_012146 [Penicillium malachiteum]KAJ5714965.1 hypothetical protein N7483_012146 [Penicillium malachiteum]